MKWLVIDPTGKQVLSEITDSSKYHDESKILWDERIDGDLPDGIIVGGMVRVDDTLQVDDALLASHTAKVELEEWEASLQAIDGEGVNRAIENIIDSMDPAQLGRLDPFMREIHTRKKALRANRP